MCKTGADRRRAASSRQQKHQRVPEHAVAEPAYRVKKHAQPLDVRGSTAGTAKHPTATTDRSAQA